MSSLCVTLALLATAPTASIQSIDDVRAMLVAGVPAVEIAARIEASDAYLKLKPEELVRLYHDGAAPVVLAAIVQTTGEAYPRVVEEAGQIELHYDGYRILGRRGPDGPKLVISGYASTGERLKPPVEVPAPVARAAASATTSADDERRALVETRRELEAARERLEVATERLEARPVEAIAAAPLVNVNVNTGQSGGLPGVTVDANGQIVSGAQVFYDSYGAPQYVSVTQIPQAYLDRGTLVGTYAPTYGFGYYGYGQPYYGAYRPAAFGCGSTTSTTSVGFGVGGASRVGGRDIRATSGIDPRRSARQGVVRERGK